MPKWKMEAAGRNLEHARSIPNGICSAAQVLDQPEVTGRIPADEIFIAVTVPVDTDRCHERAELHIVTWAGGAGDIKDYFTLNGHPLRVAEGSRHDVQYHVLPVPPQILRRGRNACVLLSNTDHHGIEVLRPGPALMIRRRK